MAPTKHERAVLTKRIATLTKRRKRWIERRNRLLLKWSFEGEEVERLAKTLYAWEIEHTATQIEALKAYLEKEGG